MKRNVMVILCDQLRKDFLPIYGGKAIDTPNIDALAADGVVFDRCITQSTVCAPARASMMTGRYVSDHGVWTNDIPFREGLDYIAEMMKDEDYCTGAFGKLHHTPGLDSKGFQHVRLMEENRLKDEDHYFQYLKKQYPKVENIFNVTSNRQFALEEEVYYERYIADETIRFILDHQQEATFSWVSFQGPHTPYDPPKKHRGMVRKELLPRPIIRPNNDLSQTARYRSAVRNIVSNVDEVMAIREAYAEMILEIDDQIGRIIQTLKSNNLYERTTIIFSADHGDMLGDMDLGEKGPYLYESQLGIPMIITNAPGTLKASRSEVLLGNMDIAGTALDLAESDKTIGYAKSILKLLDGSLTRDVNYSEFCDSIRTVENSQYRYCYYPFENYSELYDLKQDPKELNNLSGKISYNDVENKLLKDIIDFAIIAKGPKVEAQDMVPKKQAGIKNKWSDYLEEFPVVFPLPTMEKYRRIEAAGLDPDYNAFCIDRKILASYGRYWADENK